MEDSLLRVKDNIAQDLYNLKKDRKESYDSVIQRLIEFYKEAQEG